MKYCYIAVFGLLCIACSHKPAEQALSPEPIQIRTAGGSGAFAVPKATVFKMNGDYGDRVAVTLNKDGSLAYYPAPTDITDRSAPVDLGDGWWLNRQGLSEGSTFTKWTFDEYRSLPSVPSQEEIMAAVIPGSRVTEMITLPLSASEAMSDPSRCALYLPK